MLHDRRRLVVLGDQDVGEGLVVAEQHVEARAEALDEVRLEQQRFRLRARAHEVHRRGGADHARDAAALAGEARIADDALLQAPRLADIEHVVRRHRSCDRRRARWAASSRPRRSRPPRRRRLPAPPSRDRAWRWALAPRPPRAAGCRRQHASPFRSGARQGRPSTRCLGSGSPWASRQYPPSSKRYVGRNQRRATARHPRTCPRSNRFFEVTCQNTMALQVTPR